MLIFSANHLSAQHFILNNRQVHKTPPVKTAVQEMKLLPTPVGIGGENSQLGQSVSVQGNTALIGAPNMLGHGIVYVFQYDGSNWIESDILKPLDGESDDQFGIAVSLERNRALIGAFADDDNGTNSGSVYIFDFVSTKWSQTTKITAIDGSSNDNFGNSVSLYGNRILVGALNDDDNGTDSGSAYIYDLVGNNWTLTSKLKANDGTAIDRFGGSVSLYGDQALIGAEFDDPNGSSSGSAYVFNLLSGSFWSQTDKLIASDGMQNDRFGHSVSLFANTALIGANLTDDTGLDSGSAYIFDSSTSTWVQTTKLIASDGMIGNYFGYSVSLSGNTALIGALLDDDNGNGSGSAYIFDLSMGQWLQTQKLIATDGQVNDHFSISVSLSGDRALLGASLKDVNEVDSGSAYVFDLTLGSWTQQTPISIASGPAGDRFGTSVSLSDNRALIGSPLDNDNGNNSGSAYIYDLSSTTWSLTDKLTATDAIAGDHFGNAVSLSNNRVLIGANLDNNSTGSAYIFELISGHWVQTAKLTANDGAIFDNFAVSLSLSNNRALIAAIGDGDRGVNSGSVYVFEQQLSGNWSQTAKLTANDGAISDNFGTSVSLLGDRALIGAAFVNSSMGLSNYGAAYIFDYSSGSWNQSAKLTANDGFTNDNFGNAVSLSVDRALIGSKFDDDMGNESGSAYVFELNAGVWTQTQKLLAIDGVTLDNFGYAVSLLNNRTIISAIGNNTQGLNSGSAYVFNNINGIWQLSNKISANDAMTADGFGSSISLSADLALIGAKLVDERGTNSGASYVLNFNPGPFIFTDSFESNIVVKHN